MKAYKMGSLAAVAAVVAAMSFTTAASASTLLFDRGLPGANWNDPDPFVRSNFSLHPSDFSSPGFPIDLLGDDFAIDPANFSGQYKIDKVVVWGARGAGVDLSGTTFSLYMGPTTNPASPLTLQSSLGTVADTTYPNNGGPFCGTSAGAACNLVQLTFSNLNYLVNAGEWTDFGVSAGAMRLHATNANQAAGSPDVTPQELPDGAFLGLSMSGGQAFVDYLLETYEFDAQNNERVVPIDINVRVYGTQIPEPSSLALLGIALAGLALGRRGRKA